MNVQAPTSFIWYIPIEWICCHLLSVQTIYLWHFVPPCLTNAKRSGWSHTPRRTAVKAATAPAVAAETDSNTCKNGYWDKCTEWKCSSLFADCSAFFSLQSTFIYVLRTHIFVFLLSRRKQHLFSSHLCVPVRVRHSFHFCPCRCHCRAISQRQITNKTLVSVW